MNAYDEVNESKILFDEIFNGQNGFEVSMAARNKAHLTAKALTYGEITFEAFSFIHAKLSYPRGGIFYDLGSGIGKVVVAAALVGSFSKCIGVEILDDVYKAALVVKEKAQILVPGIAEISFVHSDISNVNFSDASVVYIASTCFDTEFMSDVARKADNMATGSYVITLTQALPSNHYEIISRDSLPMSWGTTTVYTQQKKG